MWRRLSLLALLALLSGGLLSGKGLLGPCGDPAGGNRPAVYRTARFDIIYDMDRPEAGLAVASVCERSRSEIERSLGVDLGLRLPVVATPRKNSLNAYYTSWPYNRIVVYDTPAWNPALLSLEGGLERVFHHELAHAVSLNIRTPFWDFVAGVAGPWASPGLVFYQSQAFAEGLAVAFESLGGGGRVGDPASMEILFQSKAEGVRPSWADISGSRDIRPVGALPYIFGGAFFARLIDERGLERLGAFVKSSASLGWSLLPGKFKKVYGVPLEREFQAFLDSIPAVPGLKALGEDLLSSPGLGALGFAGGQLWIQEPGRGRLAVVDPQSGEVLSSEPVLSYEPEACYSENGMIRAISILTDAEVKTVVEGPEGRREQKGLRRPCVAGGRLVGVGAQGSLEAIEVFDLESGRLLGRRPLPWPWNATSLQRLDSDTVLMALCDGGRWEVGVLDLESLELLLVENPDGIQIRTLGPSDDGVAFSYFHPAADGNLSRYGRLVFKDGEVLRLLSPVNTSGGVHHPAERDGRVWFVGSFFAEDRLRTASEADFELGEPLRLGLVEADLGERLPSEGGPPREERLSLEEFLEGSEPYRPASYLNRGSLLPADLGPAGLVGLSYATCDPAENFVLNIGAGYSPENKIAGASVVLADSSFRLLPLDIQNALTVGWSAGGAGGAGGAAPAVIWASGLSGSWTSWRYDANLVLDFEGGRLGAVLANRGGFRRHRPTGPTPFERLGFEAGLGLVLSYADGAVEPALALDGGVSLPGLLPVKNRGSLVLSLPAELSLVLRVEKHPVLGGSAKVALFDWETQKGIGPLSLYIRRIYLCAEADWTLALEDGKGSFAARMLVRTDFAPVLGLVLQNLGLSFYIGAESGTGKGLAFVCGVDSSLFKGER